MFDFFRRHMRVLQYVLMLFIFPSFVFFGIEGYSRFSGNDARTVAKVAGHDITHVEWDAAMREQLERAQRQMPGLDPKLFETPEMKRLSLEALVRERVLLAAADKLHLVTTDDRLQRLFVSDPQFAALRNPDGSVNRDALGARGMSSEMFAQRLRQDLSQRQVLLGLAGSVIAPVTDTATAFDAMFQQREVQVERFDAKDYLAKVDPSAADIDRFYKEHAALFLTPEQESIEYVVLDIESLKKDVKVPEEDLRKYYTENEKRYTTPEERRASHILIKADKSMSQADRDKAKAKAEGLLAEVRKDPASFAELAKKNSEDPGSAEKGGDLDFFSRGAMVKPFEDAAFGLKPGQISGIVQSDFGYHIIQLTGARGGEKRSFESVRPEIETEISTQLAQKRYSEIAVEFTTMVYEQSDSLKPVADRYKLEIKTAQNIRRTPQPGASGPLANAKFLDALFGTDAVKNKRNTEAVETGPSQMVSGRVVKYEAAHQLPLAEVRAKVREQLAATQAAALARKTGTERLAALRAAPATVLADAPKTVSRAQPRELPKELLDAVLKAPTGTLPAFVGVDLGDQGYAVAKLLKVAGRDPTTADAARAQAQYAQVWADAESQAYYAALKERFGVEIIGAPNAAEDTAASAPK
ncbi:MAG: SurA N-terminal domain-containing protein [Caldimonas sp.]